MSKGWHNQTLNPDKLVLHATGPVISDEFRMEGVGKPLCLPTVIAELCESKAYFPLSDFLTSSRSIYDPGWLPYRIASFVIGKPLWWALKQFNIVGSDDTLGHASYNERWKKVKGDYVLLSVLERAADAVLQAQRNKAGISLADSLYDFESFKKEFAGRALDDAVLSDLDLKVLLRYLERDKRALVTQKEMIKFVDHDATSVPEITVVDVGVLQLKTAVDKLQAQIDNIQSKINERSRLASTALSKKQKDVALSHLRGRKQLEDLLRKRLNSLDMLQSTLLRVEASAGDVEIMKSYESSTATLRAILAHPSLQQEKIEETMVAMASANADAKEIDDTIRMGTDMAQADAGIDDTELEEELKTLIQESERETKEKLSRDEARGEERAVQEKLVAGGLRAPSDIPAGAAGTQVRSTAVPEAD